MALEDLWSQGVYKQNKLAVISIILSCFWKCTYYNTLKREGIELQLKNWKDIALYLAISSWLNFKKRYTVQTFESKWL